MNELLPFRKRFASLENCCHLISNSLGAMPDGARAAAARYLDLWADRGVRAWEEEWWLKAREIGDRIAHLAGAPEDTVTMQANVTSASSVVLSCFEPAPLRNKVVMVDMEFPSLLYLYEEWMRNRGEVVRVVSDDGIGIDTDRLLEAIDERTLLVPISHVLFRSAFVMDIPAVVEKAHRVGAHVVVDCYQSLGTVPVKLEEWGVDFAVGGSVKWLCGGPGACYLYVRKDLAPSLEPGITGWLAHQEPFNFDIGPMRRASGSYRFLSGTPGVPALYTCQPGLDIVTEVGVERIRARSLDMTAGLIEGAKSRGFDVTASDDDAQRGGTVAVNVPDGAAVAAELNRRDFLVDHRPAAGIRISPHFYNTDDELDAVMNEIDQIVGA